MAVAFVPRGHRWTWAVIFGLGLIGACAVRADEPGMVSTAHARFTVITPTLIRMEYSPDGHFIDAPSFFAIDRTARDTGATISRNGATLLIDTGSIRLNYKEDGKEFSADNLNAEIKKGAKTVAWNPKTPSLGNLGGTIPTLDSVQGPERLGDGLLSRDGWFVLKDTTTLLPDGWFQKRPPGGLDWYLFGYGLDYRSALKSMTAVGGPVPIPRKYTLGIWFSHWWPYTAEDFKNIVLDYGKHDFPLDVLVMDMDWHNTDGTVLPAGHKVRRDELWTGYTWNKKLIPDPAGLLKWIHDQGVAVTLNDHPSWGVLSCEDAYQPFMKAMGADPATNDVIPFDASDKHYMDNFYEATHRPREQEGVDFWWLDWQQEEATRGINSLSNLAALAYYYFAATTSPEKRGQSMSRWAGWGDHRYPIYFSGDANTGWPMLAFEVPFTSTAGNVGCFYWSHDTGGYSGQREEETYTRWCQFGAVSPVLRCHSGRSSVLDRRPWTYPKWAEDSMRAAFHLRAQLMPYIYTAAWEAHRDSLPLLRPMYLDHPDTEEAYHQGQEYLFGDDLLAAPIVTPGQGPGRVATQNVWFPKGDWYNFFTGEKFSGPYQGIVAADINEFPLYAQGGVPIAMQPYTPRPTTTPLAQIVVRCYPGADGAEETSTLYEDDGLSPAYLHGAQATTQLHYQRHGGSVTVTIDPAQGSFQGQVAERGYVIELPATDAPTHAAVDGTEVKADYDAASRMTRVTVPPTAITRAVSVTIAATPSDPAAIRDQGRKRRLEELLGQPYEAWAASPAAAQAAPALQQAIDSINGFGLVAKNEQPYLLSPETSVLYCDLPGATPVTAKFTCPGRTKTLTLHPGQTVTRQELANFLPVAEVDGLAQTATVELDRDGGVRTETVPVFPPVDNSGDLARRAQVDFSSLYFQKYKDGVHDGIASGYPVSMDYEWMTRTQTVGAWVKLTWPQPVTVGRIDLYDRPNLDDQILAGELSFSDGTAVKVGELPNDGQKPGEMIFPPRQVTWVKFTVTQVSPTTKNTGLGEFAVFAK